VEKLYVFGDSIAKGVIYDEEKGRNVYTPNSFLKLFEAKTGITIKNDSKFGCTAPIGAQKLQKAEEELTNYDSVLFEFGGNDCNFDWEQVALHPDDTHECATGLKQFYDTYTAMIAKVLEKGKKVILLNLPPIDDEKYFRWISQGRCGENILKWLGGSSRFIYNWHESYNCAVANIANAMNVTLVDIRTAFLQQRNYRDYLCLDGIHPNEKGHALIAEALTSAVAV